MKPYLFESRTVMAEQWLGQDMEGATLIDLKWGRVAEVQTDLGNQWMTEGDWLVRDGDVQRVVTPAIFARFYEDAPADANQPGSE